MAKTVHAVMDKMANPITTLFGLGAIAVGVSGVWKRLQYEERSVLIAALILLCAAMLARAWEAHLFMSTHVKNEETLKKRNIELESEVSNLKKQVDMTNDELEKLHPGYAITKALIAARVRAAAQTAQDKTK